MEKKYSLILDKEFINYCELNKIEDIEGLAKKTFNNGFTILKYGIKPNTPLPRSIVSNQESLPTEKITEVIEKTKEKIKDKNNLYDE